MDSGKYISRQKNSNRREESSQGIELQRLGSNGHIQSRPGSSQSSISLPESLHAPELQLELVKEEVRNMNFQYGQGSDCRKLAMDTINLAKSKGIQATLKELQKAMLVDKGRIKGDARQSNTAGKEMWYFEEHFWCDIQGIEYDPLFDKRGTPEMDLEKGDRLSYRDCYISEFASGKAMVHSSPHAGIDADTVFRSLKEAKAFVKETYMNYSGSESE
ncbi:hypothetical protein [Nostoc sp. ChiVER01]|uniref:hypothetical protein n=1 Tax=Nostoc sp. ChiVER01 TaxID=3075382 RepID=UPI002AD36AF8|nr:hypothetical protein [Nostoc sp. ChiVER01]MDZ8221748.1 hypothetical protein [Nostoc sp. ChiVER01]